MVNKKWLADAPGSPTQVKKSPKKADETPPAASAKPGCSHWIDGELLLLILVIFNLTKRLKAFYLSLKFKFK